MQLHHIVVAVDDSGVSRHAMVEAVSLASRTGARVTAMTAIAARPIAAPAAALSAAQAAREHAMRPALDDLEARVRTASAGSGVAPRAEVAYGVPGVEICRFAEAEGADLLVLGRKRRSQAERLLIGDTADAVARRSRVPCLFIPGDVPVAPPVLAAVDAGPRAVRVVRAAYEFAAAMRAPLRLITVEPGTSPEPEHLRALLVSERRDRVAAMLRAAVPAADPDSVELLVACGDVTAEVLTAATQTGAGVLVVGYRRGGPPAMAELGSVARRVARGAACPVVTIPL